jgi:hypothetical protein
MWANEAQFESEQAARDWIDTASSDWIANHPKNKSAAGNRTVPA